MARSVLLATIVIVVSSSVNCERRSFLSYTKNFQKAVPHFWKHDQEELNRNLDKNSGQPRGEVRVGPHPPPLRPNPPAAWVLGTHHAEKELTQNRVNELKNKLTPNIAHVRAYNQPNPKPKFELKKSQENKRHKRDVTQAENEREKREVIINPYMKPEMVMQPHIQPALVQEVENQYQDKIIEKRDKRQILLMINQRPLHPLELAKKPRTTPNPFIRDTNIADYDIVQPESYKPEVEVVNSIDTDSYHLSPIQKVFSEISKMLQNLKRWLDAPKEDLIFQLGSISRSKRSPKMSKLYKKQKLKKKKRKKKKQQELSPRQIKRYRRIREKKERRRRVLHKKLKEKRRLRHKKLGTGPYNKSIIDYYGVYFDSSSSQLNDSLYDSIYDTNAVDSDQLYDEHMKNYTDSEESDYEDEEEDYSFEGSTEEDDHNNTTNYYDPPSAKLNETMFDSVYDTKAVDSDQMYEEHMKDYPESSDDEEESSEEENNGSGKESNDVSKGGDSPGKDNAKKKPRKSKEKSKDKSENLKNKNNANTKRKTMFEASSRKSKLIKNGITKRKPSVQAINQQRAKEKGNMINKPGPKITEVKKHVGLQAKTEQKAKPNRDKSYIKHTNEKIQTKVKEVRQSETNQYSQNNLLDVIFDKPKQDKFHNGLNYQVPFDSILNTNDFVDFEPKRHIPAYENIIPIMVKSGVNHRRIPI